MAISPDRALSGVPAGEGVQNLVFFGAIAHVKPIPTSVRVFNRQLPPKVQNLSPSK